MLPIIRLHTAAKHAILAITITSEILNRLTFHLANVSILQVLSSIINYIGLILRLNEQSKAFNGIHWIFWLRILFYGKYIIAYERFLNYYFYKILTFFTQ